MRDSVAASRRARKTPTRTGLDDSTLGGIVSSIVPVVNPDSIILFGSRARGDYGPSSDIDILVISDLSKMDDVSRCRIALAWLPFALDVIVEPMNRYLDNKDRFGTFEYEVERGGMVLYGQPEPSR